MMISIDGIRYHVEIDGVGFPLLLLHGFTGDTSTWKPFRNQWGHHSRLIIPDLIGHGKTESPQDLNRYQIESAAKDLKELLDYLNLERVDLLGYSMGGRLALTFAILYPDRVRRLILESASPGLEKDEESQLRRMKDTELAHFIIGEGMEEFVAYWEAIPLFSSMEGLSQHIKDSIRSQRLSNNPQGLANSLLGMGTGFQPSWWGAPLLNMSCEVLLLTGEVDKKFCMIAKRMQKMMRNAKWVVIKNAGHAIHVEEAEKFGTIVSDFVEQS
jgi:2-succinyl-6-hydroxy-2,4-cyclohexadiene-1-carboxylate synthase